MHSSSRVLLIKTLLSCIGIHDSVIVHPAFRWLPVVLWMGVIFTLSAIPSLASPFEPLQDFILRKFAHIAEYVILTALLFSALRRQVACNTQALLIAAVMSVLYAFSDEWHQTFVPGREGSLRDVGIDAAGVIGMSLWFRRPK
jgi:VanZ family protein